LDDVPLSETKTKITTHLIKSVMWMTDGSIYWEES